MLPIKFGKLSFVGSFLFGGKESQNYLARKFKLKLPAKQFKDKMADDPYLQRAIRRAQQDVQSNSVEIGAVRHDVVLVEQRVITVENQVNAANFNYIVPLRSYLQVA